MVRIGGMGTEKQSRVDNSVHTIATVETKIEVATGFPDLTTNSCRRQPLSSSPPSRWYALFFRSHASYSDHCPILLLHQRQDWDQATTARSPKNHGHYSEESCEPLIKFYLFVQLISIIFVAFGHRV